ncbi:MAG: hypothetical protein ACOZQL_10845 [Myxococcota bacterium]
MRLITFNNCTRCDESVNTLNASLCDACAVKELRERVAELLGSATPNPSDHPRMTWAWERARKTMALTGGELER